MIRAGSPTREVGTFTLRYDQEAWISSFVEESGDFFLSVAEADPGEEASLEVELVELRPARDSDPIRAQADRILLQGSSAESLLSSSTENPEDRLTTAIRLYQSAGDQVAASWALGQLGRLLYSRDRLKDAAESFRRALDLSRTTECPRLRADLLNGLVKVRLDQGETDVQDEIETALQSARAANDYHTEAEALDNQGRAFYFIGKMQEAIPSHERALGISENAGCRRGEARSLMELGYARGDAGQDQEALVSFTKALTIWQDLEDPLEEGTDLMVLGALYTKLDRKAEALDFNLRARDRLEKTGNHSAIARALTGLGQISQDLGRLDTAIDYYEKALDLYRDLDYPFLEVNVGFQLGWTLLKLGRREEGRRRLSETLEIAQSHNFERIEAMLLWQLAQAVESEDPAAALAYLRRAYDLNGETGDPYLKAEILNASGQLQLAQGHLAGAKAAFLESADLNQRRAYRYGEADALYRLAEIARQEGTLAESLDLIDRSIRIIEEVRTDIGSGDLKAAYLAASHRYYQFYLETLMRGHRKDPTLGLDALAFEISERARARALIDSFFEAGVEPVVDAELTEKQRRLTKQLGDAARLQFREGLSTDEDRALTRTIRSLITEANQLEAAVKARNPRYAALAEPDIYTCGDIQQRLLDPESVLLEYYLGDSIGFLWAITSDGLHSFEIPPRQVLEEGVRKTYALATSRIRLNGESVLDYRLRVARQEEEYWKEAALLSEQLLGPAAAFLKKRIILVSEGLLLALPFSILPSPLEEGKRIPLIAEHEIVNLPSASVLALIRRDVPKGPRKDRVVVFADPIFDRDDPRIVRTGRSPGPPEVRTKDSHEVPPTARPGTMIPFSRLPATRREAESVLGQVPGDKGTLLAGGEANRQKVLNLDFSPYRIVHFATHGWLDSENPELSGILLSRFDESGADLEPMLRLRDLYGLHLPADLVVLSACRTALGKEVRGEGLIGLVRGFLYAGARRVLASHWMVDDEATRELMSRFYRAHLGEGMPVAKALKTAQLSMWQDSEWSAPFYWGSFELQGDWD